MAFGPRRPGPLKLEEGQPAPAARFRGRPATELSPTSVLPPPTAGPNAGAGPQSPCTPPTKPPPLPQPHPAAGHQRPQRSHVGANGATIHIKNGVPGHVPEAASRSRASTKLAADSPSPLKGTTRLSRVVNCKIGPPTVGAAAPEGEVLRLRAQCVEITAELASAQVQVHVMEQNMQELREEHLQWRLQQEVAAQREVEVMARTLKELHAAMLTARAECTSLRAIAEEELAKRQVLEVEHADKEQALVALVEGRHKEAEELRAQTAALAQERERLKRRLGAAWRERDGLRAEVAATVDGVAAAEAVLVEVRRDRDGLAGMLTEVSQERDGWKALLAAANRERENLLMELSVATTELAAGHSKRSADIDHDQVPEDGGEGPTEVLTGSQAGRNVISGVLREAEEDLLVHGAGAKKEGSGPLLADMSAEELRLALQAAHEERDAVRLALEDAFRELLRFKADAEGQGRSLNT
eukprot:SM000019S04992  [mRNA]  locus=s19:370331:373053:- [translate_table: standard]